MRISPTPSDIKEEQTVRIAIGAGVDAGICGASLTATPTLKGTPIGAPVALAITSDDLEFLDTVRVRIPVADKGKYGLLIAGMTILPSSGCLPGQTIESAFSTTIQLFGFKKDLPGPPTLTKVTIGSSGPHTLVANTWARSTAIRITFTITDPERREDLLHSMCMGDTDDCWFEDVKLKDRWFSPQTQTGWLRTWDFWWERSSPSQCYSYYWNQPDISVILVVSNREGKTLGRKKHSVRLTCRS